MLEDTWPRVLEPQDSRAMHGRSQKWGRKEVISTILSHLPLPLSLKKIHLNIYLSHAITVYCREK